MWPDCRQRKVNGPRKIWVLPAKKSIITQNTNYSEKVIIEETDVEITQIKSGIAKYCSKNGESPHTATTLILRDLHGFSDVSVLLGFFVVINKYIFVSPKRGLCCILR